VDRRTFLTLSGAGAAGVLGLGGFLATRGDDPHEVPEPLDRPAGSPATTAPQAQTGAGRPIEAAPTAQRRLVVVELEGGNDGMATLVPYGDGRYHDLRSATAIDDADLLHLDDHVALSRRLEALQQRGLAIVQGVGVANPDLSHFAMMQRWWTGDPDGTGGPGTGFLGRLCDVIGDPAAPFVGLAIGSNSHPSMAARNVATLSIPGVEALEGLGTPEDPNDSRRLLLDAIDAMASAGSSAGGATDHMATARAGLRSARALADSLQVDDNVQSSYPGGQLSDQLQLAAGLLAAQDSLRVVHVGFGGFDTHENEPDTHPGLLEAVGSSVVAFLDDLDGRGLGGQVVVATTSEFGRRARDNGSRGLDHGAASVGLLAGAVRPGLFGTHPSLSDLDDDDNLKATVGMADYYATLAQWLGVPASDVLSGGSPLDGILA
jgi:uncharacterized protein (DUF1501 family)